MSPTKGTGPFGERPAGAFDVDPHPPKHVLYLESTPRRVRVLLAGEPVADSHDVRLVHPPGRTPMYLFPGEHVGTELLEGSERRQSDPGMSPRTYWSPSATSSSPTRPGPRMLLESGLPPRWYLPRDDVRSELLEPSDTTTRCPYKGTAHYWSVRTGSRYDEDLVRTRPGRPHDAEAVRGLLCSPQETVDVEVIA